MFSRKNKNNGTWFSTKFKLNNLDKDDAILKKYKWELRNFTLERMLYENLFGFSELVYFPSSFEDFNNLFFHATIEDNAMEIMRSEIKPMKNIGQRVWSEDLESSENWEVYEEKYNEPQINTINNCKKNGIYFFKEFRKAIEQSLVTVEKTQGGNPALVILETFDDIFIDPETKINKDGTLIKWDWQTLKDTEEEELGYPLITLGKVQVIGVCSLKKSSLLNYVIPCDVGSLLSHIKFHLDEKYTHLDSYYLELTLDEMERNYMKEECWMCKCRKHPIIEKVNSSIFRK